MSEDCNNKCSCEGNCSDETQAQANYTDMPNELSRIKKVIGVVSGKGGVGKSLVTSLLAVLAQRDGFKTAILDADITGPSIPQTFGLHERALGDELGLYPVKTKTGISVMSLNLLTDRETDPVIWRGPIIAGTVKQFWTDVIWGDIDYMFIDMPPGTGDVPLTVFQSIPVDGIIIVTSPQELVGMIVEKAVNMARMMDIPVLGIVENMSYFVCPDCDKEHRIFGESRIDTIAEKYSVKTIAKLPINPKLSAACDAGMIELFDGDWLNNMIKMIENEEKIMKIAVTYEDGQVFQHFGHTEMFKVYDIKEGKVASSSIVSSNGSGHGALAGVLKNLNVDTLICGGIGGGAKTALTEANIKLYGGVSGEADKAVEALLSGTLKFSPEANCDHHGEHHEGACGEHGCGEHHGEHHGEACGEHGCGNH